MLIPFRISKSQRIHTSPPPKVWLRFGGSTVALLGSQRSFAAQSINDHYAHEANAQSFDFRPDLYSGS